MASVRKNRAISAAVSAVVAAILVLTVGFGLFISGTFDTGTIATSTATTSYVPSPETTNHSNSVTASHNFSTTTSSSEAVQSSQSACTPSSFYWSTTTLTEQSSTATEQVAYDGTTCNFGDNIFEPPSAIMIPANTLVWTDFRLNVNTSYFVGAAITFFPFPESVGANVTVAIYTNGSLVANSTTRLLDQETITQTSLIPPSNSSNSNSIFTLDGVTPTVGMGAQSGSPVNLNGATIGIAMISDKPLWLAGWTQQDMSKGKGSQFGQSIGQLNGTYEWTGSELSRVPNSLPQPTTTLTFELQFTGDYFP